jgi:tight adherence protein B
MGPTLDGNVLAILVFLAVGLATVSITMFMEWLGERKRRRGMSDELDRLLTEGLETLAPGSGNLFRPENENANWLLALGERIPRLRDLDNQLEQSGLTWTAHTFLLLSVGLGATLGFGMLLLTVNWVHGLVGVGIGSLLPYAYMKRRLRKRMDRFQEQLSNAIELMTRALQAGHPLSAGFKMVAEEMSDPAREEFRRVFEEQKFGLPFVDTMTALSDRVPLADVRIFVTAVLVQREVGGNLTEILDNLTGIIRERFKLQRQMRVLTAEGRMGGYVLSGLPVAVGIAFYFLNPSYIMTLFTTPQGNMLLVTALVMQMLGFLWIRKITTLDF